MSPIDRGRLAHQGVITAQELALMVRDEGRDAIGELLDRCDRQRLYAIIVALAAMVPVDWPAADLLAWVDPRWADVA